MNKFYVAKIFIFILLLIFLIGFVFFRKDSNKDSSVVEPFSVDQRQNNVQENNTTKRVFTEEDKIKRVAESFASIYYSYSWGNFSNIELQYSVMTKEMKSRESEKVEQMKKEIENKSQKIFSVRAEIIGSELLEYKENDKATVNIKLKINRINAMYVTNIAFPKIKPETSAFIDDKMNVYKGNIDDLISNVTDENAIIKLVKIAGKWKVNEIHLKSSV